MMIVAGMRLLAVKTPKVDFILHIPRKVANFGVVSTNHTIGAAGNSSFGSHDF